jgi:hypothetical protein
MFSMYPERDIGWYSVFDLLFVVAIDGVIATEHPGVPE